MTGKEALHVQCAGTATAPACALAMRQYKLSVSTTFPPGSSWREENYATVTCYTAEVFRRAPACYMLLRFLQAGHGSASVHVALTPAVHLAPVGVQRGLQRWTPTGGRRSRPHCSLQRRVTMIYPMLNLRHFMPRACEYAKPIVRVQLTIHITYARQLLGPTVH
jgi:hypothetical protein